jgi:hypothetical protein
VDIQEAQEALIPDQAKLLALEVMWQHTMQFYTSSESKVNGKFLIWLKTKCARDNIGEIKAKRGKEHDYLAITLNFIIQEVLKVDMSNYIKKCVRNIPKSSAENWNVPKAKTYSRLRKIHQN